MATRTQKYPDTGTFHYYNANPHHRITGDCTIRAIATAAGIDYNMVCMIGAIMRIETGYSLDNKGISIIMERLGWTKHKQPRKMDGTKYTGKEFCELQQSFLQDDWTHGNEWNDGIVIAPKIVANIGGHHIVAIVDGKVWDIWNSTGGCIGNYWTKEG